MLKNVIAFLLLNPILGSEDENWSTLQILNKDNALKSDTIFLFSSLNLEDIFLHKMVEWSSSLDFFVGFHLDEEAMTKCRRCTTVAFDGDSLKCSFSELCLVRDTPKHFELLTQNDSSIFDVFLFSLDQYEEKLNYRRVSRVCPQCGVKMSREASALALNKKNALSGASFRVCVEHSPPLQIIPEDGSRPTGFFPDLFYEVQVIIN